MSGAVHLEVADGVALVTVDNPPVNALTNEILESIGDVAAKVASDPDVRAVVLTGAGDKSFIAGADLDQFASALGSREWIIEHTTITRRVLTAWEALPQPTIAAAQAAAVGGGFEVALVCDLIVADPKAVFGCPEVKLGLIPGAGGTQRLPRRIPPAVAKQLLLTGSVIGAEEAQRLGIVNSISEPGQALDDAKALAAKLANLPALAVQAIKACANVAGRERLEDGLDKERELFMRAFQSEDVREGVSAFLEKRKPAFSHR